MASGNGEVTRNVGFVATHISGTDGVSLEIAKWTTILEGMGFRCFYLAGRSDRDGGRTFLVPEADFQHPVIESISRDCFGHQRRSRVTSDTIHATSALIKNQLYAAVEQLQLDLLIAQNALTIPMNIPLGAALVELLIETGIPCIAHHHDFVWERERYLVNAVEDYLRAAFPPPLSKIQHVVINSVAGEEFSRRTGLPCRTIPNVMDFAHPPEPLDEYARDFRRTIGVADDEILVLQPTRVVRRKGIEHSIELVRRLGDLPCRLVVTHGSSDEGPAYQERLTEFAALMGVDILFADRWIADQRGTAPDGSKQYSIWDVYPHADLVSYPSNYEGFGNAFLEAVYYRKPVLCNRYSIYRTDIEPCGFQAIVMDGFLTDEVLDEVRKVLINPQFRQSMVEHNYEVGRNCFSFERAESELRSILARALPLECRAETRPSPAPTERV